MIMRGLTLANSGGQVGELSMQHAHPRILHPPLESRAAVAQPAPPLAKTVSDPAVVLQVPVD